MRICMITSAPFPPCEGVGFYVWNLSRHLVTQGHQVQIITRGHGGRITQEVVDGITIWRPSFLPAYPFHVHLHSLFVNRLVRQLAGEVDVFHLHSPLVKLPKTGVPVVVTVHTPMKTDVAAIRANNKIGMLIKLQAPVSFRLEQELFSHSHRLLAVASSVAAELQEYDLDPASVGVLGNGVDTAVFSPGSPASHPSSPYFLTVGRLAPRKGLEDLVEVAALLRDQFPHVRFLIAGTGPLEGELRAQIDRCSLGSSVVLLGHVAERARLVELYRGATAYVHPAHYEGLPTVLLEAMACARPVIATAVSGALDVVENGHSGVLVPPHQPSQLAEALVHVLGNPEWAHDLGIAARQTVMDRYSWQMVGRNYVREYERVVQERAA